MIWWLFVLLDVQFRALNIIAINTNAAFRLLGTSS